MPSACTKPEKKASPEVETPIKQCLNVVDKKVRNLEKRKGKLDDYREKAASGTALNADQLEAVSRYDTVVSTLEYSRELQKQFVVIQSEVEKLAKKQMKRESHERQQVEIRRLKELLAVQNLLDSMGALDVRADFEAGSKGSVKLNQGELNKLDALYKLISPSRAEENNYTEQLMTASEHIVHFLDAREKEVIGTSYKDLKAIVEKVNDCGYFDVKTKIHTQRSSKRAVSVEQAAAAAAAPVEVTEAPAAVEEAVEEPAAAAAAAAVEEEEEESAPVAEPPAAAEPEKFTQESDYSLQSQQLALESLQASATIDFAGDAAAATMLGQPQQASAPGMPEPTDSTAAAAAAAEDTFFSTQPFPQPRPFNEIVSSVQGNFDFLQDSEIEQAKAAQQMGGVNPQVPASADLSFLADAHSAAAASSQYQTPASQELSSDGGQQSAAAGGLQFTSGDLQQQQPSAASSSDPTAFEDMYNSGISQGLQSGGQQQYESSQGGFGADSGADSGPQPIPMPGQYNTDPEQSSAAASAANAAAASRQFAMNPNADIFQSMYQGGDPQGQQGYQQGQGAAAGAAAGGAQDSRQQQPQQAWGSSSNDFQTQAGYGAGQYGGGRRGGGGQASSAAGGGGGYRGGGQQARNGANGAVNNGYRGGGGNNPRAPGNQRGSRGGAYSGGAPGGRGMQQGASSGGPPQGGGGGAGGMRGSAGSGGAYKGYPARNDYQPEGGYQGYNASSSSAAAAAAAGGFMQPGQGGPRGGPRNSVPRGGGGGGGGGRNTANYGNRMPPQ